MQIIKPLRIGYMSKPVPDRPRSRLALTGLVCFDLLNPETLYTEQSMWNAITPELGEQGALDLWMPKRRGEVFLWGNAAAPGGVAVTQMQVSLQVGETIKKTLTVHGDRHWEPTLLSARISKPTPFMTMPLTYEHAFGGPEHLPNPVGKGHAVGKGLDTGASVALPNLEYASNPLLHPNQEPAPACFKPVNPSWPGRAPLGTYDDAWIKHRYPAMPLDFDWDIYNLAPLDQRIPAYFRGDEDVQLTGLHPDHPKIHFRLPGLAMRFFSLRNGSEVLEESPAVLDSVCLFPSVLRGVLIYRCELELEKNYEAQDISSVMLACERSSATRSPEYYKDVFRLRSGKDRGLYALSDFQLMPPFSEKDQQRLEARREEVRQERVSQREKKDQWFAAHAAAAVGFALPDGFFKHADEVDQVEMPIITDLDHELGNPDLAGIMQAVNAMEAQLTAHAAVMRQYAEQELAMVRLRDDAIRAAARSGDFLSVLPLFPPSDQPDQGAGDPLTDIGVRLRTVADRVEAEPTWSLAQAAKELSHPFLQEAMDRGEEGSTPSEKTALLKAREAMGQDAVDTAAASESPEARSQFVATLRKIAAAFAGESDSPTATPGSADMALSESDRFLQAMGLSNAPQGGPPADMPKPDDFLRKLGEDLRTAPPDQMGEVFSAALAGLPGAGAIDWTPMKTALQQAAAQSQSADVLRNIGAALLQPSDPQQSAAAFAPEKMAAALSELTDGAQKTAAMAQLQQVEESVAHRIAAVSPAAVTEGKVDWARFLEDLGVGDAPPAALAPLPAFTEPESDQQQNLRRARALAAGMPDAYRLGFDLPPETPEEIHASQLLDDFFSDDDPAWIAGLNAATSEFLQASQDVMREEGGLTANARNRLVDRVITHALKQPDVPRDTPAAKKRRDTMRAICYASGGMANSILRKVLPDGEKMFRAGRQQSPVPLVERADVTDEIAAAVGAIVRQDAGRGLSLAGRDLVGADLRGARLSGVDLTGAFLEHANLSGADLSGAQCEGAVFSGACLEGVNLRGAFLRQANFGEVRAARADFSDADMTDANLFQGDFTAADLSRAGLGKCNALKTIFIDARLDDSTCEQGIFLEADLSGASFIRARWHKAVFINARLDRGNARGADLRECVFASAEARGCDFSDACLDGLVAVKSCFQGLLAVNVQAARSGWAQCDLGAANFFKAHLEQSCFLKADLNGATFSRAMLRRAVFLHASLRAACLTGSQLYEATLRGADLTDADLRFANLHCADLENATLDRCDMTGARRIQSILEKPSANPAE